MEGEGRKRRLKREFFKFLTRGRQLACLFFGSRAKQSGRLCVVCRTTGVACRAVGLPEFWHAHPSGSQVFSLHSTTCFALPPLAGYPRWLARINRSDANSSLACPSACTEGYPCSSSMFLHR